MLSFRQFSAATIKYSLFIFNLILVISAVILLCLGFIIKGVYTEYETLLDDRYFSASSLLIASGCLLFLFAFLGCCGAIKENRCMILVFSGLLSIIFILELATSITGYVLSDQTDALVSRTLNSTMQQYNKSHELTQFWDTLQTKLTCCGTNNYTDWYSILPFDKNQTIKYLPLSCCDIPFGAVEYTCSPRNPGEFHVTPCKQRLATKIEENSVTICAAALSILFLQLIGIVFSCYLAKYIKASSYESV